MELRSLNSPSVTSIYSAMTRTGSREKLFRSHQMFEINNFKMHSDARKVKLLVIRAQTSGTTKFSPVAAEAKPKDVEFKDEDLLFVAGATGRVGSRTVRELLKLGFRVRAGVRSAQRAETLLQSVKQMKLDLDGTKPIEKLEIVECDLEKPNQIGPAFGNASVIICCIGASEKEVFDVTGPYRIDYQATKNLIDAATVAKVDQFILLTSLGTNKIGFPAAILNLFWGVLIWKRKAEEALLASGLPYTIVRPGGMERPTDAYKETHNITLSQEDTLFGGQVSNLQVAELMAFMAKNRRLSCCKVVEVIAERTAPLTPMGELLADIPAQRAEVCSPKESEPVGESKPAASKSIVSEPPSTPVVSESVKATVVSTQPLSPYFVYDDLKPPSSPTPSPPGRQKDVNIIEAMLKATATDANISSTKGMTDGTIENNSTPVEVQITNPLSPYIAYDNLKPPSSPSPSAPSVAIVSDNNTPQAPLANHSGEEQLCAGQKRSPLSPFTMYEDLKPPTSPTPRKL